MSAADILNRIWPASGDHHRLPEEIPEDASTRTEMFGAVRVFPIEPTEAELFAAAEAEAAGEIRDAMAKYAATEPTQTFRAPDPLPRRPSFRDRCEPAFAPAVSAGLRADFRDLPAFRATVRTTGLAGLHLRTAAGRTERKLP
jgi:hypothetical protein